MGRYLELAQSGMSRQDGIICSSRCGREVIEKCFAKVTSNGCGTLEPSLEVVPLGIDEQPYVKNRDSIKKTLGLHESEVTGLAFGRFSDFDKMDLFPLLQAFKGINPSKFNAKLILAGAVHDRDYFNMLKLWTKALGLEKFVSFVEEPDDDFKSDLYAAADYFVSIADNPQETFGLTVLESMNAGTPLIVSDFDGYRELVTDEAGIKVPVLWSLFDELAEVESIMDPRTMHRLAAQSVAVDVRALERALYKMVTDAEFRNLKAKGAKRRFDTEFAHRLTIKKLETIWGRLKRNFKLPVFKRDILKMDLFETFSGYVTGFLNSRQNIKTTEFGRNLMEAKINYPLLPGMSSIIDADVVTEIMKKALNSLEAGELWQKNYEYRYIVLWMIKHDLLQIC
jgi:glycosyltransferase involved in cell wall biosynthesis